MTPCPSHQSLAEPLRLRRLDEQLLRVALLPTGQVASAWSEVRAHVARDELDVPQVYHLVPLLADALGRAGVDDPALARMKGVRRHTFFNHQLLLGDLAEVLAALEGRGVRTMVLKGLPLALLHYPHPSLRPMSDFDVLVDRDAVPVAMSALEQAGWRAEGPPSPRLLTRRPEMSVGHPTRRDELDLHWRLVPWLDRRPTDTDPALWAAARPIEVHGHPTLAPSPHDLLLHVILHAYRSGWSTVPRWVADAAMVVRSSPDLDWDRFVARGSSGALLPPVRDALQYATALASLPVPGEVLDALGRARTTRRTRRRYAAGEESGGSAVRWATPAFEDRRRRWARRTLNQAGVARTRSFVRYVLGRSRVARLSTHPQLVLRALWRRARHMVAG